MNTPASRAIILLVSMLAALPGIADDEEQAADFMMQELESVVELSAFGRQLYKDDKNKLTGRQYCSMAVQLADEGEFRQALRAASKALYLGQDSGDSFLKALGTRDLALAYSFANDLENAERLARDAIENHASEGGRILGPAYKVMGDVRMRQQQFAEAVEYYTRGYDRSPAWMEPMFLASLARAYAKTRQYDIARQYYDKAAEYGAETQSREFKSSIARSFGYSSTWLRPSLLRGRAELAYLEGDFDTALELYDSLWDAAEGDFYQEVWMHVGRARVLWAKGDRPAALAAINEAVSLAEEVRARFRSEEIKIGLFSNLQDVFDEAIDMHMAEGLTGQALLISEKSRARALLDMVRNRVSLSDGTKAFSDPLRKVAGREQIQAALPADTALVVYHSNQEKSYAWVVRKGGIKAVTLPQGRDSLARTIRQLRTVISQRGNADGYTRTLYQQLIQPLQLQNNERVILVPHKALHFLPFQALQGPGGYLIEAHRISQVPSASMLVLKKGVAVNNGLLLALGNPKLSAAKYDLPGAQAEVEAIARHYSSPKVYVREQATRSRVTEEGPASQVIHIAAHAEVDSMDPLYSRILLSPQADGKKDLEARDIYQIDLHNTRLVVLSACRSGLGNVTGGDEIIGFTRTFISAGADNVVVSLWDVEDTSTAALMERFYQGAQKADLASALQQAQQALLKNEQTRHPFFWAGFNLVGTL